MSLKWSSPPPVLRRAASLAAPTALAKKSSLFDERYLRQIGTTRSGSPQGCDPTRARRVTLAEARKNSQFFREKLGIFKALIEGTVRHSLGRGLGGSSLCQDREFASRATDYFEERTGRKEFSIREDLTFKQMQKVVLADVITDADAGAAPVRHPDGSGRIQLFPSASIGNGGLSGMAGAPAGSVWEDGILRLDGVIPLAYRVQVADLFGRGGHRDFPLRHANGAAGFWHIGRTDRINGNRPMPWLHHSDEAAINITDLRTLEMAVTKLNSYFAGMIKTASGELPPSLDNMINQATGTATVAADGDTFTQRAETRLAELYGSAALIQLGKDDEFHFFGNQRQSTNTTAFIDYLIADMAVGFGIPTQFVWALTGMAGPFSRMVLQQADWFFSDVMDMLVSDFCQPIWEAVIADGMWSGALPAPKAGTNWRAAQWQGPGSLTIDRGRDGKLFLELIRNGAGRRSTWHELNGLNGSAENRKTIEEIRDLMALCDEMGVPHNYFFGRDSAGQQMPGDPTTDPLEGVDLTDLVERIRRHMEEETGN